MPVVALGAWAVAQVVLFRLYLLHRYTYPLAPFFAIAVAVSLRPTWLALATARPAGGRARVRADRGVRVRVLVFPLALPTQGAPLVAAIAGAAIVVAAAALLPRPSGPVAIGATLIAALLMLPGEMPRGNACPTRPVDRFLGTLPKDAVIAGDPRDLMCVPATTRRAVVISTQLAPAYEAAYFRAGRARMFADLRAYYGPSASAIADLGERCGATHLLVRSDAVRRELRGRGVRWRAGQLPYGRYARGLVRGGDPAVLRLPAACRRFARGPVAVYEIACLSRS